MICADCAIAAEDERWPVYRGGCEGCLARMLSHARDLWRIRMLAWLNPDERERICARAAAESRAQ